MHANNVLRLAQKWALQDKQKLIFRPFLHDSKVNLTLQHSKGKKQKWSENQPGTQVGLAAIADASFMQQLGEGSQCAYCIMIAPTTLYEGKEVTHLIDWNSGKIHRKVGSTLAAEAHGASRAYDRAMYARAMIYEIESGRISNWTEQCKTIPFCLGTDCKSLYDVCMKEGSIPQERRVALDLLDVKEGIERMNDQIRWVPTDHMLVDCMTKFMPPALMLEYLHTGKYAFKYDKELKDTKRVKAKERKVIRDAKKELAE
jgi:hypothetical protein